MLKTIRCTVNGKARELSFDAVSYTHLEPLPVMTSAETALAPGAPVLQPSVNPDGNLLKQHTLECNGTLDEDLAAADVVVEGAYRTPTMQHCHLENQTAYAYMDDMRHIVIVSSTQIPHICRRVVGQALGIPWSSVRVIKPYIGGGFGNKPVSYTHLDVYKRQTDHCSFSLAQQRERGKESVLDCPGGVPGVETRIPLLFSEGVLHGRLTLPRFVDVVSTSPARIMGLASKGRLEPGADADIVVIDPTDERLIKTRNLHQKVDCTPYEGMVVRGWPRHVWLRGEPIIFGRQLSGYAGQGRFVPRTL